MRITQLTVNRSEAEKFVQNQIQKGKAITSSVSFDDTKLDLVVEKVDKWEAETRELLLELFDSDELADEFTDAAQLYSKGPDLQAKLYYTGSRITYKNYALEDIIKRLSFYEENVKDPPADNFWDIIHPAITGLCKSRFDTEHYADCIETAFKYVNNTVKTKVKKKTGAELDGAGLMNTAFSPKNPIISLDDLSTESGKK